MKKRMILLLMSLFALTPAIMGTAWGAENRGKHGSKQECELLESKHIDVKPIAKPNANPSHGSGQTLAN